MHGHESKHRLTAAAKPAIAAIFVCVTSAVVAALGVMVTAGGVDQHHYHWPTVNRMQSELPTLDITNVETATSPLYHVIVAIFSRLFGLTESQAQFVASIFAAGLAALVVWYAASIKKPSLGALAAAPLLLSPYFWQSALWMLNDAAALLFCLAAFIVTLRQRPAKGRSQLAIGFLLAAAIATRQSYIWCLAPTAITTIYVMQGYSTPAKMAAIARIVCPGLATISALVLLWNGVAPPNFQESNAGTLSWTGIPYTFAVCSIFFFPVLVSINSKFWKLRRPLIPIAAGIAVSIFAFIFRSDATHPPDSSRRGSLVWNAVDHAPVVADRSLLLAFMAFVGAYAVYGVLINVDRKTAILVGVAIASLAVTMVATGRLYQKYFELPITALILISIVTLAVNGKIIRRWPLIAVAALQCFLLTTIVIKPIISTLI